MIETGQRHSRKNPFIVIHAKVYMKENCNSVHQKFSENVCPVTIVVFVNFSLI